MTDLGYMEELDNVANTRTIVNNLMYKLRERWRGVAFDIQEQMAKQPKFNDLVKFINMQAKVAPLYGDIKDSNKGQTLENLTAERKSSEMIFTTSATLMSNLTGVNTELKSSKRSPTSSVSAFTKPCLFCQDEHSMVQSKKLSNSLHKEKIEFHGKGLCSSSLKQWHMSKSCEEKLHCEVCSLLHPTVLHIKNKDKVTFKEESSDEGEKQSVISGFVDKATNTYSGTGAGDTDSILAIVPVQ